MLWTEWNPSVFKFLKKTYLYVLAVPLLFIGLGAGANQAVMIANGGAMPVIANLVNLDRWTSNPEVARLAEVTILANQIDGGHRPIMIDPRHCIESQYTHLNFLADNFDFGDMIASPGDLLLWLGEWLMQFAPIAWFVLAVSRLRKQE